MLVNSYLYLYIPLYTFILICYYYNVHTIDNYLTCKIKLIFFYNPTLGDFSDRIIHLLQSQNPHL